MINHIQQPERSSLCGQSCVAMVKSISLEESIKLFSKKGGTSTREVCSALDIPYPRLKVISNNIDKLPDHLVICKVTWNGKGSHWIVVVKSKNLVLDPSFDKATFLSWYLEEFLPGRGWVTFYLDLKELSKDVIKNFQ